MSRVLTVNMNKKPIYDIVIEQDFEALANRLEPYRGRRCMIVTDSNVGPIYQDTIISKISDVFKEVHTTQFKAGEDSKNMVTVQAVLKELVEHKFDRKDCIIALGGGVTGDLAGFTASIYMRGIDVIQIPTSLLAQVDSSIGGKTGVDFDQYKNMVGAFYMPKLVYINTKTLDTLDARQFYSGMAEVMKYGLIMDASFYEWILEKMYEIHDRDSAVLEEMIETCCMCKQRIVERDPYENGERAILNFGHTLGHAIEKYMDFKLLHGECVALGCVCAAFISWKKEKLSMDEYYEVRDMFVPFNLPITITDIEPEKIVALTKSDKKSDAGGIKFILLKKVGKAVIDTTVTEEEMLAAVKEIHFSDEDQCE